MWLGISQRGEGREWVENGEQRGEERGAGVFICSRWARCVVVSIVTEWAAVRRVLDGVVVSVQGCSWFGRG
jgi:hypothetical protein